MLAHNSSGHCNDLLFTKVSENFKKNVTLFFFHLEKCFKK